MGRGTEQGGESTDQGGGSTEQGGVKRPIWMTSHPVAMSTRERQRDRGARRARTSIADMGRELRDARRALGLRQADVARAADVSRAWVSEIELGRAREVGLRTLSILLAVVGLDLSLRAYPGGSPLRDEGHRALLERFRGLLPEGAPWRTEVPFALPGDQRAWDAMTRLWGLRVGIEAEMRPTDLQALERRLELKARDGGADRLILVLADSRPNRRLVRLGGPSMATRFPLQGAAAIRALRSRDDPRGNLLVLV